MHKSSDYEVHWSNYFQLQCGKPAAIDPGPAFRHWFAYETELSGEPLEQEDCANWGTGGD